MLPFLRRRWFLFALVGVLLCGYTQAEPLRPLSQAAVLRNGIVFCVMFLMAFPLGLGVIAGALRRPGPALLASALNFGLVPLAAWAASAALRPLSTDMAVGMIIAGSTPCTLASAAVWTRRAGGNDAVALMVTLMTNLVCFVVTPFWLITATGQEVPIDAGEMVVKLAVLVVTPISIAQLLRLIPGVGVWAAGKKTPLSVAAQVGVLSMIGLGAIKAGLKLDGDLQQLVGWDKAAMTCAVMAVHLSVLGVGFWTATALKMQRGDCIAVAIAGSQKTLMIGLWVATEYFHGLALLPMIVYHVGQLIADTVIADQWREAGKHDTQQKPKR